MKADNAVTLMAGAMVLIFTLLSLYVHGNFVYATLFVGAMMVQSSFTGFCPAKMMLKSVGFKD